MRRLTQAREIAVGERGVDRRHLTGQRLANTGAASLEVTPGHLSRGESLADRQRRLDMARRGLAGGHRVINSLTAAQSTAASIASTRIVHACGEAALAIARRGSRGGAR